MIRRAGALPSRTICWPATIGTGGGWAPVTAGLRIVRSSEALAREGSARVVQVGRQAQSKRGRFLLGLAGGRTPAALYRELAKEPRRSELDWSRVTLLFGD